MLRGLNCVEMCASGPNLAEFSAVRCATLGREMHRIEWHVMSPDDGRSVSSLGSGEDPRIPLMQGQVLMKWANRGKRYGI